MTRRGLYAFIVEKKQYLLYSYISLHFPLVGDQNFLIGLPNINFISKEMRLT